MSSPLSGRTAVRLLSAAWLGCAATCAVAAPFDVYYRAAAENNWIFYGGRETRAAADAAAAELGRSSGFETKVVAFGDPVVRPGTGPVVTDSVVVGGTPYVRRPGLGYAAGWYRHGGGWSGWSGWGGGYGGWGGGYGGYAGSSSRHHHSSHHHSHEHRSSSHHHSGNHATAHPGGRGAGRAGRSAGHHAHSHSHSHHHHSHHSHHGGHHK